MEVKEVGADIFRQVEQLMAEGYSRDKIDESLTQMGYSIDQANEIFQKIEEKKERQKQAKQKKRMMLLAGVFILFIAILAAVGLLATAPP